MRYVVPHTLDKENLTENEIRLQMRVKAPIEAPVTVQVFDGENLIAKKSEQYARPGEMIEIKLTPKRHYDSVSRAANLTVQVVEK